MLDYICIFAHDDMCLLKFYILVFMVYIIDIINFLKRIMFNLRILESTN